MTIQLRTLCGCTKYVEAEPYVPILLVPVVMLRGGPLPSGEIVPDTFTNRRFLFSGEHTQDIMKYPVYVEMPS